MHSMRGGGAYSDGDLPEDDAHFVFEFIKRVWNRGALAVNYARALEGKIFGGVHHTGVCDQTTGDSFAVKSRGSSTPLDPRPEHSTAPAMSRPITASSIPRGSTS